MPFSVKEMTGLSQIGHLAHYTPQGLGALKPYKIKHSYSKSKRGDSDTRNLMDRVLKDTKALGKMKFVKSGGARPEIIKLADNLGENLRITHPLGNGTCYVGFTNESSSCNFLSEAIRGNWISYDSRRLLSIDEVMSQITPYLDKKNA